MNSTVMNVNVARYKMRVRRRKQILCRIGVALLIAALWCSISINIRQARELKAIAQSTDQLAKHIDRFETEWVKILEAAFRDGYIAGLMYARAMLHLEKDPPPSIEIVPAPTPEPEARKL